MRVTVISAAAGLMLLSLSTSLMAQRPDADINPRSVALVAQGEAARAGGQLDAATDAFETALVVDPRNRQAFLALAQVAMTRELPGKAIRYYREALLLDPNDIKALRGQGEAMVAKGALERAKENLARVRTLCGGDCPDAAQLSAVIAKGPPPTATAAAQAQAPAPQPTPKPE